jgi:selenocysteine lyase/cysteine desulfurase
MADLEAWEVRTGRAHIDYFEEFLARMDEARGAVAAVLGTDVDAVALNHSTTDGMNQAIGTIDWRAATAPCRPDSSTPAGSDRCTHCAPALASTSSSSTSAPAADEASILAAFDVAITPGTRLVEVAHVSPLTGAVMPVAAIAELAHARGALFVVDGAQAAGAMPVDVHACGADFYAIPAHKVAARPGGMGALAVAPNVVDRHYPAAAGAFSFESFDPRGRVNFWPDARRFDSGGYHRPSVVGMGRSIGWLSMYVGLDWIHRRGAALARVASDRLARIPGVEVITPPDRMATLVTFRIGGWPASTALDELGAASSRSRGRSTTSTRCASASGSGRRKRSWSASRRQSSCSPRTRRRRSRRGDPDDPRAGRMSAPPVRRRSWAEVRWRQFRNAPRPVVRAVASSLAVAIVLAAGYVLYDLALSRGAALPGGDLRVLAVTVYVVLVLLIGSLVTWLIVPLPSGSSSTRRRTAWSAALGFFAAVPIAYLVMVAAVQIVRPLFG